MLLVCVVVRKFSILSVLTKLNVGNIWIHCREEVIVEVIALFSIFHQRCLCKALYLLASLKNTDGPAIIVIFSQKLFVSLQISARHQYIALGWHFKVIVIIFEDKKVNTQHRKKKRASESALNYYFLSILSREVAL